MRVTVTFYARLAELAGRREWQTELPATASARDAWNEAVKEHEPLGPMSGRVSCAINAEFAPLEAAIRDGDEIAFLPPVSGGRE